MESFGYIWYIWIYWEEYICAATFPVIAFWVDVVVVICPQGKLDDMVAFVVVFWLQTKLELLNDCVVGRGARTCGRGNCRAKNVLDE